MTISSNQVINYKEIIPPGRSSSILKNSKKQTEIKEISNHEY